MRRGAQARRGTRGTRTRRRRRGPRTALRWSRPSSERGQRERDVDVAEEPAAAGPRHAAKLQHRAMMKPTLVQYEAPGWGVGEVWLDERGPCLPRGAAAARGGRAGLRDVSGRTELAGSAARRSSPARPDDFRDVKLSCSRTGSTARARARCGRAARRGRHLRRARRARRPARRGAGGRDVLRALRARRRSCRRTASSAPTGIGSYGVARRRVQAAPAGARRRAVRSPTTSATSSRRSRRARRCCRLAELSALFHSSGRVAPARRTASPCTSTSRARPPRGARSRCCATSASARRSAPTGGRRSSGRRATSCTSTSTRRRSRCCARRASSRASGAPLERPAEARRRPLVLPRRLPARRAARRRLAVRARATRISSSAPATLDGGASSSPRSPRARTCALQVAERRSHAVAYAKGHEAIGDLLALAGRRRHRAAARGARRASPRPAPRRTASRTPTRRTSCAPRAPPTASSRRSGRSASTRSRRARRDRRAAPAPPVRLAAELAAKARPPITKAAAHRRLQAVVRLAAKPMGFASALARGQARAILTPATVRSRRAGIQTPFAGAAGRGRPGGGRPRSSPPGPPTSADIGFAAVSQAKFDELRERLAEITDLGQDAWRSSAGTSR